MSQTLSITPQTTTLEELSQLALSFLKSILSTPASTNAEKMKAVQAVIRFKVLDRQKETRKKPPTQPEPQAQPHTQGSEITLQSPDSFTEKIRKATHNLPKIYRPTDLDPIFTSPNPYKRITTAFNQAPLPSKGDSSSF